MLASPPVEARVLFPAGTCQSWDLQFRMEMTLVKSLHKAKLSGKLRIVKNDNHYVKTGAVDPDPGSMESLDPYPDLGSGGQK